MQNLFQIKIPKCRPFSIGNAKIRTVIQHHSVRCILRYDFCNLVKTHYGMVVDSEKRIRRKHFFKVVQRLGTSKVRSISKMQVANGTIADNVCNVGYDDPFDFLAGFENQYVFTRCHSRTKIRKSGYMEQKKHYYSPVQGVDSGSITVVSLTKSQITSLGSCTVVLVRMARKRRCATSRTMRLR